jgi:transcriptional regulator
MYSPAYAVETDPEKIRSLVDQYPFATLTYTLAGKPEALHLPLEWRDGSLWGHLARANPAARDLAGAECLVIFHGPDCYISPKFYGTSGNVPTWNYMVVHVRGRARLFDDPERLRSVLVNLSRRHDPTFDIGSNIEQHARVLESIRGIEIEVLETRAKFKLGQSKPAEERHSVVRELETHEAENDRRIAEAMRKTLA